MFSLLGDLFAPSQRAFVAALVQIAMGFGMSLGQLIAGVIGASRQPAATGEAVLLRRPGIIPRIFSGISVRCGDERAAAAGVRWQPESAASRVAACVCCCTTNAPRGMIDASRLSVTCSRSSKMSLVSPGCVRGPQYVYDCAAALREGSTYI